MAGEEFLGKAPDSQVDASIVVDFSAAETSAKGFEQVIEALDERLGALKSKLEGLPTNLSKALDKELSSLGSGNVKLNIDVKEINASLKEAIKHQVDNILKNIDFAKSTGNELESLVAEIKTDINEKLRVSFKKATSKLNNFCFNVSEMSRSVELFSNEAETLFENNRVFLNPERIKESNEKLKVLIEKNSVEILTNIENLILNTDKILTDISEYTKSLTANITSETEPMKGKLEISPVSIREKISNIINHAISSIDIDLDKIGRITLDGDVLRNKINAVYSEFMDGIYNSLSKINIGIEAPIGETPLTANLLSQIEQEMNVLANKIVTLVLKNINEIPLETTDKTKLINLDSYINKINEHIRQELNSTKFPDIIIPQEDIEFIQGLADRILEHIKNQLTFNLDSRILSNIDSGELQNALSPIFDRLRTNLVEGLKDAIYITDTAELEKNIKFAVTQKLNTAGIELSSFGEPIIIEAEVLAKVMREISLEINKFIMRMPIRFGSMNFPVLNIDNEKFKTLTDSLNVLDEIMKKRTNVIDDYVSKQIAMQEATREAYRESIEQIVKAEGGIVPYKKDYHLKEYLKVPQSLRNGSVEADIMAQIVSQRLGLKDFYAIDLVGLLANSKIAPKKELRAEAEKFALGINDLDKSIIDIENKIIQDMHGVLDGIDIGRFKKIRTEDKAKVISNILNEAKTKLENIPEEYIKEVERLNATMNTPAKSIVVDIPKFERQLGNQVTAMVRKFTNTALSAMKNIVTNISTEQGDAGISVKITEAVNYAMKRFADAYTSAIHSVIRESVISQTITSYIQGRLDATLQSILEKRNVKIPKLNQITNTALKLIIEAIENGITQSLVGIKIPKTSIKIDTELMKMLLNDIEKQINLAISSTAIPTNLKPINISNAQILEILNAVENTVHQYVDQLGRSLALAPALTVPTNKLSRKVRESIEKAQGTLPLEITSSDVVSHLMLVESQAIEGSYTKHLRRMISQYKSKFTSDLENIDIEPNRELSVYFLDSMHTLQNKIYKRIRQILQAQMDAFNRAVEETIVEPVREIPNVERRLNVYNRLTQPVADVNRALRQQANESIRNVEKNRHGLDRVMYGTGMHILAGSLYSAPFYLFYKMKETLVDLTEEEAKIRQNILASPEAEYKGVMDTALSRRLYNKNFEPFMNYEAVKYGQKLEDVYKAGTIVTRRNRPIMEQKKYLDAVMRLNLIDNVTPEDSASILEAVMAQFKLNAWDLDKVIREITAAVSISQATAQDIGETLKRASVIGKSTGLGTAEMITLAAVMSQSTGQKGDVIGTFLKTVLDRMTKKQTQPLLDEAFKKAYEKGLLKEPVGIYNEKGKLTSPLKILSAVSQLSTQIPDKELFNIYRTLFGEWQKGRGVALLGELAPSEDYTNENQYMNSIKDYLMDVNTMLEKVKGLTEEQEKLLVEENTNKASFYLNRLNSAFQIMIKTLANDGAFENFKTFANAITDLMLGASKNPQGLQNTVQTLLDLIVGLLAMKTGQRFIWGEKGIGNWIKDRTMSGVFGEVNLRRPSLYTQGLESVSNELVSGVPQNRRGTYRNLMFGDTFDYRQAVPEERITRAFERREQYLQRYNKLSEWMQKRYNIDSTAAESRINKAITNRINRGDLVNLPSGRTRQLFNTARPDLTWMERLRSIRPDIESAFASVRNGAYRSTSAFSGLNAQVSTTSRLFSGMKNVGGMFVEIGRGLGNVAVSLGKAAGQMAIIYVLGKAVEKIADAQIYKQLTPSQKVEKTSGDITSKVNEYYSTKQEILSEYEKHGANPEKLKALDAETITSLHDALPGLIDLLFGYNQSGNEETLQNWYRNKKGLSVGSKLPNDIEDALSEFSKLDLSGRWTLSLKSALTKTKDLLNKIFNSPMDYESLSEAIYNKKGMVNAENIDTTLTDLMEHPTKIPHYSEHLNKVVTVQAKQEVGKQVLGQNLSQEEIDALVQKRVAEIIAGGVQPNLVVEAIVDALTKPLKEKASDLRKIEDIDNKELEEWQNKIDAVLNSGGTQSLGADTELGLSGTTDDTTGKLLTRLRRVLGKAEDETVIRQLQLKQRGFTEDTSMFRQSMITAKTSELGIVRSQISELQGYKPEKEDEQIAVEERIAELNRKMWETLVEIKELQENQYGTFNLPEGIKPMSNYEYYQQRNTEKSIAVSAGDMYVTFQIDNVSAADKGQIKDNLITPAIDALNRYKREQELASSVSRQFVRKITNYGG